MSTSIATMAALGRAVAHVNCGSRHVGLGVRPLLCMSVDQARGITIERLAIHMRSVGMCEGERNAAHGEGDRSGVRNE